MNSKNKSYLLELLEQVDSREGDYLAALDMAIQFVEALPTTTN